MTAALRNILYGAAMAVLCFLSFLVFFTAAFTVILAPFYILYRAFNAIILQR